MAQYAKRRAELKRLLASPAHVRGSAAPVRVASVAAVLDGASVCADLLGADLLAERGLGIGPEDRRAVGEVLAHQLEYADLVVTSGWLAPRAAALLEHLVTPGGTRGALYGLDAEALVSGRPDSGADARVDARRVRLTGALGEHGVWTVDLSSWRPLHPQRLLERIEALGAGRLRGRGAFWLPTRPGVACAWDGAGGQLSIGSVGPWGGVAPHTRLVITGVDEDPRRLQDAFEAVLMTDAELGRGLHRWVGRPDESTPGWASSRRRRDQGAGWCPAGRQWSDGGRVRRSAVHGAARLRRLRVCPRGAAGRRTTARRCGSRSSPCLGPCH